MFFVIFAAKITFSYSYVIIELSINAIRKEMSTWTNMENPA